MNKIEAFLKDLEALAAGVAAADPAIAPEVGLAEFFITAAGKAIAAYNTIAGQPIDMNLVARLPIPE